jgi:hypothetical protein
MDIILWRHLPQDAVNLVLTYDGRMVYRHGVYMNRLIHPNVRFPLIYERMRFHPYRQLYTTIGMMFVVINHVPNTAKYFCYTATCGGVSITIFSPNDETVIEMDEHVLYSNLHENDVFWYKLGAKWKMCALCGTKKFPHVFHQALIE